MIIITGKRPTSRTSIRWHTDGMPGHARTGDPQALRHENTRTRRKKSRNNRNARSHKVAQAARMSCTPADDQRIRPAKNFRQNQIVPRPHDIDSSLRGREESSWIARAKAKKADDLETRKTETPGEGHTTPDRGVITGLITR